MPVYFPARHTVTRKDATECEKLAQWISVSRITAARLGVELAPAPTQFLGLLLRDRKLLHLVVNPSTGYLYMVPVGCFQKKDFLLLCAMAYMHPLSDSFCFNLQPICAHVLEHEFS